MSEPKTIRFIKPWHFYAIGHTATPSKPMRDILFDRGLIVILDEDGKIEKAPDGYSEPEQPTKTKEPLVFGYWKAKKKRRK